MVPTDVPMVNVALSGSVNGGVSPGLTVLAGPSKHFKTSFALLMAGAYLNAKPDAVMLFYDSEFGSPQSYFTQFGIDTNRVLHTPIANVEELKFDMISQLENLDRSDDVIIVIDSIGNLASKKELEDALAEKGVADMSRAKALKGLFRMSTPYLAMKNIPMIAINHTYKEIGLFPKDIVSGGTGIYYSADNIWIIGRRQEKQGTEIVGYDLLSMWKSLVMSKKSQRFLSEFRGKGVFRSIVVFSMSLLLVVMLSSLLTVGIKKLTQLQAKSLGNKVRTKDTLNAEFWEPVFETTNFAEFLKKTYMIGYSSEIDAERIMELVEA